MIDSSGAQVTVNLPGKEKARIRRVLVCPNAFKGSLSAHQAAQAIAEGLHRGCGRVKIETVCLPLADGGDGTMETLVAATGGQRHSIEVQGPRGETIQAQWGELGGARQGMAILEMAEAAGLRLLTPAQYDPRVTTTYGVGQMMLAAVRQGCHTLVLGIGGSATNDGGAGMAQALGARLLDAQGQELPSGGAALSRLARIDLSGWRLSPDAQILVACDVDNPLCGPEGASAVYGPQKGADAAMIGELDAALAHYADALEAQTGIATRDMPGAGAAGGLGAGLLAFCGATLLPGTDMVLEITGFEDKLAECDLVITGEGRLDTQTARGKVIAGVAKRAKARGIPVVALAGSVEADAEEELRALGVSIALSIAQQPLPLETAMREGYYLLSEAAARVARLLSLWATSD